MTVDKIELLPFLKLQQTTVSLYERSLHCCWGKGMRFSERKQCAVVCGLKKRLAELNGLLMRLRLVWGRAVSLPILSDDEFKEYWQWLVYYHHHKIFKGYTVPSMTVRTQPSRLWSIASMAIWRFGFSVYVYNLGKDNFLDLLQFLQKNEQSLQRCIVFVEVYQGLWNLSRKEELSFIINWCEKSLCPLWMCVYEAQRLTTSQASATMTLFQRRIAKHKHKPVLQWLASDARSKLTSLCFGVEAHF